MMRKRMLVGSVVVGLALGAAALLMWPQAKVSAQPGPQINAEGCSCSKATTVGAGREQLSIYYCVCPGMQCVITSTAAGSSTPPTVKQSCRDSQAFGSISPR